MKHVITYTADTLNAAQTVIIPDDFPTFRRGQYYTEIEVTIEGDGVIDPGSEIDITAKRIGSTDGLTPTTYGTFDATDLPQSYTYYGTFSEITATPNAAFIASAGTFKLIVNAGETDS